MTRTCTCCGTPSSSPCNILISCDTCGLVYDQPAYRAHLTTPCEHGIRPMLACDLHGIDCPYNNPVWRHQNELTWTDKERPCEPLYQVRTHHRCGMHFSLYRPPQKEKAKAPRPPAQQKES